ncbi:RluA family pseudouridine synthase [Acetivibrio ethanolgignens]|uniref:Pseudouridine synthase n=1 Tax=Acetivibrio ethanolgignens TaxID=290052 RepID=A0A0V8QH78_9FIRM|nr:RluA family pseudouridine synthase [Acetivibrio ethanolgignens]KSV59925.1 RNA pseudouridine synthase [Acetivibrio ethanolgignens]
MIHSEILTITVSEAMADLRIDKLIAEAYPDFSRSYIQKLIKDGQAFSQGKPLKANYKPQAGEQIQLFVPEPEILSIEPENIPLDIVYEDADVILVNKPKDMVVHPAPGHYSGTLVNALMYHCKENLSGINGVLRPGIVHRIDKDTTGLIIACKNDRAHNSLAEQLKIHSITRKYNALVYNSFKEEEGTVSAPIGRHPVDRKKMAINYKNGKEAVTHYRVLENFSGYAHIECSLETGRTHQIRVHMTSISHPLLGDEIYGPVKSKFHLQGQALHARVFGFIHPTTGEYMEFEAPLPAYFTALLNNFRN